MEPRIWGAWSEWVEDTEGRVYRVRQDAYGNHDWEWGDPRTPQPAAPRGHDELVESLQNVNLGENQNPAYNHQSVYTYSAPTTVDGGVASVFSASSVHAQAAHHGKEKGRETRSKGLKEVPKGPKKHHQRSNRTRDGEFPVDHDANQHSHDPFYQRRGGASHSAHTSATSEKTYGTSPYGGAGYTSGLPQNFSSRQSYHQSTPASHYEEPEPARSERHDYRGHDSDSETTFSRSAATDEGTTVEDQGSSHYTASGSDSLAGDVPGHDSVIQDLADTLSQVSPYMPGAVGGNYSPGESSSMAPVSGYSYSEYALDSGGRDTPKPQHQQSAPSTGAEQYSYYTNPSMNHPPQQSAPSTGAEHYSYQTSPSMSLSSGQSAPSTTTSTYSYQTNQSMSRASHRELNEHSGYAVHHSSKFRPGAIFKIIWSEPLGNGGPRSEVPTVHQTYEDGGQAFYQGLRRFVVVANDEGNCTCVPILTYERQGCNKRGVKPLKHGIIYQAGKRPRMLSGEPDLGFNPVRVVLRERTEQLVKESRVNYAKLQTIEHNFRVYFIGHVDPDDFRNIVIPAVDFCWESKRRHNN